MSFSALYPAMWAGACSALTDRAGVPMITASSAGQRGVVVRADQRPAVLGEQDRVLGPRPAGLLDVRQVVQPDADDLVRAGDERGEVQPGDGVRGARGGGRRGG